MSNLFGEQEVKPAQSGKIHNPVKAQRKRDLAKIRQWCAEVNAAIEDLQSNFADENILTHDEIVELAQADGVDHFALGQNIDAMIHLTQVLGLGMFTWQDMRALASAQIFMAEQMGFAKKQEEAR